MDLCPTVAVKTKDGERMFINTSDFDVEKHELFEEPVAEPSPELKAKKAASTRTK